MHGPHAPRRLRPQRDRLAARKAARCPVSLRAGATASRRLRVTVTAVHLWPPERGRLLDPTHLVGLSRYLMFDGDAGSYIQAL